MLILSGSSPLLAVGGQKRSGLILCKSYYAEFAGPGAAVGTLVDQSCTTVIAIGAPRVTEVTTHEDRQRAYGLRIQWVRWLQKITDHTDPSQRAEKLFAGLEAFFGKQILVGLSDEVLALLAGVLPQTIEIARSQHRNSGHQYETEAHLSIVTLHPQVLQAASKHTLPPITSADYIETLYQLPHTA